MLQIHPLIFYCKLLEELLSIIGSTQQTPPRPVFVFIIELRGMVDALTLLKEELSNARETFESTVSDIVESDLYKSPGGKALPLGALWAHLVMSEDMTVHQFLQNKKPLFDSTFKNKTGASEPMPAMDEHWSTNHEAWANHIHIDFPQFREYEKQVYSQTEKYINTLKNEDLDSEVNLGAWGKKTVAYMLYAFIIGHTFSLTGEISAIKGVHGKKGYAF